MSRALSESELIRRRVARIFSKLRYDDPTPGSDGVPHLGFAVWGGAIGSHGYGNLRVGGRYTTAPRWFLERKLGRALEDGKETIHSCDYRACCDERHLSEGSHDANMQDASSKGRSARGARHGSVTRPDSVAHGDKFPISKLTASIVVECRRLHAEDPKAHSFTKLAARFGVNVSTLWEAVNGVTWKRAGRREP